jgi:asparagine synthase (glutamine-hydrolysing)
VVAAAVVAMSGLVGLVSFDGSAVEPELLEAMAMAAPHRAQDGTITWFGAGAGFVYQRKRVLARAADEQGLVASEGLVCVADARIDNRDELLDALSPLRDIERDASDAQILLAAYRCWGAQCAARVVGDFAFAVWDSRARSLFVARDPLAMRSLAFRLRPGRSIAVGTEVKQLLALPDTPVRIHEAAVMADLIGTFGAPDWSFYEGIENLPPGHFLLADAKSHQVERFWAPDPGFRIWLRDEQDYAERLRDRFAEAVANRLRTDRPAGILLSGGVDSGSAAATAGWLTRRAVVPVPALHAFSYAFERFPQCDERPVSRLIARQYGLLETDVAADDLGPLAHYPEHGPDRDDPFLGAFQPSIEHALAAARAAGVGVMLGGDRGDLLFGTTGWSFLRLAQARRWSDLRLELAEYRRGTADSWWVIMRDRLVLALIDRMRRRTPREWVRRLTGGRASSAELPAAVPPWIVTNPSLEAAAMSARADMPSGFRASRARRYEYIFTPLHLRGMAWSERTYARHGLTFADPFSDRRLVDFALALPQTVINRPGDMSKPLMRTAMRGVMNEEARRRMDKVLPRPRYEAALGMTAVSTIRELMTKPRLEEFDWIDADAWRSHYEAWLSGALPLAPEWWWAIAVEVWLRRYW